MVWKLDGYSDFPSYAKYNYKYDDKDFLIQQTQ